MNRFNSRSSAFLMEIIVAILFFSLVSALCLQIFLKSRQLSTDTADLNMAASQARNAAELMKNASSLSLSEETETAGFFPDCILQEYPDAATDSVQTVVYFDKNWNYCTESDAAFCMKITPTNIEDASLLQFLIEVVHTGGQNDSIYSLDLDLHVPNHP